ncbi:MAG: thiamine diphosphokinase, partial [Lachnospiraceae bacterium]
MEIQKKCYIIGSGEFEATYFHPGREDYLIAADGGYHRFVSLGLIPNLLIGDFDSIGKFELSDEEAREKGIRIERLPKEKNDTDLLAAIRVGLDEGCRDFHIFGGTGGRIDHTIANI